MATYFLAIGAQIEANSKAEMELRAKENFVDAEIVGSWLVSLGPPKPGEAEDARLRRLGSPCFPELEDLVYGAKSTN